MLNTSTSYAASHSDTSSSIMPLLDVMLLLLIFFLLASVFARPTLEIDLPEAAHSEPSIEQNRLLTIAVRKHGDIFLNNRPVSLSQLQVEVKAALAKEAAIPVLVRADKQSVFATFIRVMDAVKGAGAQQLIIETQPAL